MEKEFEQLSNQDAIKAENDFLKMKMMLEHGAQFGSNEHRELSPEIENQFLKNIMAFEKHFENPKRIKVYDKIGRPTIFKPAPEIAEDDMQDALDRALDWLSDHNINLDVCSPNISIRELYRFITEELFYYEMDDMDLPGWTSNFIYDDFHPDPLYDNERAAVEDCIKTILDKETFDWLPHFKLDNIRLNDRYPINEIQLIEYINNFKNAYDKIECIDVSDIKCEVIENTSTVTGNYIAKLTCQGEEQIHKGKWLVAFETADNNYWYIENVQIEGINF